MSRRNALYAQSGGVTAVINASACGVIETARKHKDVIGRVFGANNGILGALTEELIDTGRESERAIAGLRSTPSGAFGSCRYKLKSLEENEREYHRLIEVFRAHDIGYFFYNGGGDSQDTAHKVSQLGKRLGYPIRCVGIPKTVDNDLPFTDTCPGFGSVAKYVAVSVREAAMDVASMCETSTKVFIMEVMGRHAGWIAAASGLAAERPDDAPHVIVFPEVPFSKARFLKKVKNTVDTRGFCVIVVSEGARYTNGRFLADAGKLDAFGHVQLGGVAPTIAAMINDKHGYKYHWAVADYLQRAARHIASKTDVDQAYAVGKAAVERAIRGQDGIMVTIRRTSDLPYRWTVGEAPLHRVANVERRMPKSYISKDGFGITARARRYLAPLVRGEDYPRYKQGLPQYTRLKAQLIAKKLPTFSVEA